MTRWRCVENNRIYPETKWLRLKFKFWSPLVSRWNWPDKVCKHYRRID